MIFGIASYKRPDCKTVSTLLDLGIREDEIVIATQTEEDHEEYKKRHSGIRVVYSKKDSAAGNRNTLLENVKERVLLLDDDITSFKEYKNGKWIVNSKDALTGIIKLFDIAMENGCEIFGISASSNAIVTRNRYEYDFDCLLQGTVIGVFDVNFRFDERWKMVEDYEYSLRALRKGKRILRANWFCAGKPKNGSNIGGLHDRYANGELRYWISTLGKVYPEFKPNNKLDGGMIRRGR